MTSSCKSTMTEMLSHCPVKHYSGVSWVSWRLKSPATHLLVQNLVQASSKWNIKVLHHWPLWKILRWRRIVLTNGPQMLKVPVCRHRFNNSSRVRASSVDWVYGIPPWWSLSEQFYTTMAAIWWALHIKLKAFFNELQVSIITVDYDNNERCKSCMWF